MPSTKTTEFLASTEGKEFISSLNSLAEGVKSLVDFCQKAVHVEQPLTEKKRRTRKPKDPLAPKHPLTSYMLFVKDQRAELKTADPPIPQVELVKEVAKRWREMDATTKQEYIDEAETLKEQYRQEMSAYKDRSASQQDGDNVDSPQESALETAHESDAENIDGDSSAEESGDESEDELQQTPQQVKADIEIRKEVKPMPKLVKETKVAKTVNAVKAVQQVKAVKQTKEPKKVASTPSKPVAQKALTLPAVKHARSDDDQQKKKKKKRISQAE
jgi:hypothetical protein